MSAAAQPRPVVSEAVELRPVQRSIASPEFDLLIACCADLSSRERAERIRQILLCPLDWHRLLELAEYHGVIPRVYGQLSTLSELMPRLQIDALRCRYEEIARKALWFTGELARILAHLESRGIRALPYKGPVLGQLLYGDVTQRQFGDLDLLIQLSDVIKAKAALSDLGYRSSIKLAPREERAYIDSGYEYSFNGPRGGNLLELQWRILPRFYSVDFDLAGFLERSEPVSLGGHTFRTLCPKDLLLVLYVHAAKHVWVQLSRLCDIDHLAKSDGLDWEAIRVEAKRLGIARILALNFLLARKLLNATLPPSLEEWLQQDRTLQTPAEEIQRIIVNSEHYDTESVAYFRLMMRLRERWQDRARFLWRLVSTPSVSEWSAIRLPAPFFPLYRGVRLLRLGKRLFSAG